MSAFIVDKYHVQWLNTYASHHHVRTPERTLNGASYTHDEAATLLYNENVRSVGFRYKDNSAELAMPETTIWHRLPFDSEEFTAGKCLAALACLEYQSCECPDYRTTPAWEYLEAIRHEAIRRVDGYEGTWELVRPELVNA